MVDDLLIFRHIVDLTIKLTDILETFPRKYKFTLGDRLMDFALTLEADAAFMKRYSVDKTKYGRIYLKINRCSQ